MKRVWLLVLCLTMVLSLCACGEDNSSQKEDVKETETVTAAVASMYVMNLSREMENGSYTGISAADLDTSQKLVDECIVLIKSNRVMNTVAEKVNARGFDVTGEGVRASLRLDAVEETALLRIVCITEQEDLSLVICEELLKNAPAIIESAMNDLISICPFDEPALQQVEIEK